MTTDRQLLVGKNDLFAFSKQKQEPDWFSSLRQTAYDKAAQLALPTPDKTKIDNWNFTKFHQYTVESKPIDNLTQISEELINLIDIESNQHNLYIQRNHTAAYASLTDEATAQGVILTDIFTALKDHSELVKKYYMTSHDLKVDTNKLTALNTALLNGGVFLYIPKNIKVTNPIQTIFLVDQAEVNLFNHVIIVAEDGSEATYVENYFSAVAAKEAIANLIAEVYVGKDAKFTYGAVDTLDANYTTYLNRTAIVAGNGKMEWALGQMNDCDTISENITHLRGDGSFADTKTVVIGRGEQKQNFTTKIIHYGKHSEGFILKHGVMKDQASSIFNGIGHIEHGASKSNAQQSSRVLMLSDKARGDANPILLIDEDDVTAGHAASVGRVDATQLYYLMSRGISRKEAERLIIHGFLAPVVNELPIEKVKNQLVEIIERKVQA